MTDSTTNRTDLVARLRLAEGLYVPGDQSLIIDTIAEAERLRTKLAGHDEGLDRWCHYQDRLVEALDRLGLRRRVLAELERDGWRNVPECGHKAQVAAAHDVIRRLRDGWKAGERYWWQPSVSGATATARDEVTPEQRAVLDAVAGPNDTEENRDG